MANLICATPGCGAVLSDPCVAIPVLFGLKADLVAGKSGDMKMVHNMTIEDIDNKLKNEMGLRDHEEHFYAFIANETGTLKSPEVCTITCFRDHVNQYTLTCP
jgi:hypothetical protein